ncbi:MAG: hypothetical protein L0Y71_07310 [Gemmataceae bacterium]|nr:hypothetical protein [Gemmataceae bacterium]
MGEAARFAAAPNEAGRFVDEEDTVVDKVQAILLEALRQGSATAGEQRLYRAGKLPGLLPSRSSLHAEAAVVALRDGLIEIVRTETRGKTAVEWVRVTPKGVQFVLDRESPVRAMDELQALLKLNEQGFPGWVAELRQRIDDIGERFLGEVQALRQRFEALVGRVEDSLKRTDKYGPPPVPGAAGAIPWAHDLVEYLERRAASGMGDKCAMPELFGHLKVKEAELSIKDFHIGLRRLHDRGSVRLLPHEAPDGPPEPEYALLDGPAVYWYAAR